jgi:tRNA 2-thiouridine synthesizing protein A
LAEIVDARGLKCPLPVLKMEKRLAAMPAGGVLTVLATDPIAKIDIPLYCTQNGHGCAASTDADGTLRFAITKA